MMGKTKLAAVGLTAVVAMGLAACGGGSTTQPSGSGSGAAAVFDASSKDWVNKSDKKGGNLRLLASDDCDSWDPANTYYGWCWNMQRIFTRSLMGYSSLAGPQNAGKVEPDLAAGPGEHNADLTQWTYKIKDGVKYEDGTPIKAADFKYALGRLFATDIINGGPTFYYTDIIKAKDGYKGVFTDGPLEGVDTPDDKTVVINLKKPFADMDYLMALSTSAPVPQAKDTKDQYTLHPVASGPYKIKSYTPKKEIVFDRNPNWDPKTDTIRQALADTITLTINSDPDDSDKKVEAGQADAIADGAVQATFQAKIVSDPKLKANADNPVSGSTRYLVLMPSVPPLDNKDCRIAVFYAVDKAALRTARGGNYAGDVAHTMANPSVEGSSDANPYPSGADETGDLTKAKEYLTKCGKPNGFDLKMAYVNKGKGTKVFEAVQTALKRVGINLISAPGDSSTYYSKYIGSPANIKSQGLGIAQAGWGADFPSPVGFWNTIANGKAILPTGNSNYSSLNDPVVNDILDRGSEGKVTDPAEWKKLDAQVMDNAVMLPYLWEKDLYYRNPRLTNVRSNFAIGFGLYDWVNVGTSDGK